MSSSVHLSLTVWGADEAIERFTRLMRSSARAEGYGHHPDPTFSTLPFMGESPYVAWHRLATERPVPDDGDLPHVHAHCVRTLARALHGGGDYPVDRLLEVVPASEPDELLRASFRASWFLDGFGPPDGASRERSTIRFQWEDARRNYDMILGLGSRLERLGLHYVIRASDAFPLRTGEEGIDMEYFVQVSDHLPEIHVESSDAGERFVRFLLDTPNVDMMQRLRAWAPTRFDPDTDLPGDLAADPGTTFRAAGWELVTDWWSGTFDDVFESD